MEKMKISLPIIVEGRYDKSALSGYIDGVILTTGGFSVFNNKEKQALLRRIGADGVIILTDSDGGGKQIRSFLLSILDKDKVHNLFIPKIFGKEKRKRAPSRSGTLGVEGMEKETILKLLAPFSTDSETRKDGKMITKVDFFSDNLSGTPNASDNRRRLCAMCDLPDDMTANALLEAMNLLYGYDEYKKMIERINRGETNE